MVDELKTQLSRTGFTLRKLALHIAETDRSKLPPEILNTMLVECPLPTVAEYSNDLVEILRSIPDVPAASKNRYAKRDTTRRTFITEEMRSELDRHLISTRVSVLGLCRTLFPHENPASISSTISQVRNGRQTTLPQHVWRSVIAYLRDIEPKAEPSNSASSEGIVVVPEAQAYPQKKTSISERRRRSLQPDLNPADIPVAAPRPDIKDYVLSKRLENMGYVVIDDALYEELHAQRRRTCVSAGRLFASSQEVPPDLRDYQIKHWFSGKAKSAERHHIEWILESYRKLPDANKK